MECCLCHAPEGQRERPTPSRGAKDEEIGRGRVGEQYLVGGALGDDTTHRHVGMLAFCIAQSAVERGRSLILVFMRGAPDEERMCLGPVHGAAPGAYGFQRRASRLGLVEGEADRSSAACGVVHADHDGAVGCLPVLLAAAYDDNRAGSVRRQGTADRAQQCTRDRSSSPATCYDGGGASGLPQQGCFGVLGRGCRAAGARARLRRSP